MRLWKTLGVALNALRPFPLVVEPVAAALIAEADEALKLPRPAALPHLGAQRTGDVCIDCNGIGRYPTGHTCKSCGGSGLVLPGDGIPTVQGQACPRWRHKKRGTTYIEIGRGKLQSKDWMRWFTSTEYVPVDGAEVVIYRADADGTWWVRPVSEFDDGRFEPLPSPPADSEGKL